ncbi:hypothetical protein D3C81_2039230 [compost metagenome]
MRNRRTFLALQRIQVGPVITEHAISGDQLRHGDAFAPHFDIFGSGNGADRAMLGAFGKGSDDGRMRDVRFG